MNVVSDPLLYLEFLKKAFAKTLATYLKSESLLICSRNDLSSGTAAASEAATTIEICRNIRIHPYSRRDYSGKLKWRFGSNYHSCVFQVFNDGTHLH